MLAEKILNIIIEIESMAHEFTLEQWGKMRAIKEELKDAHMIACELENKMPINVEQCERNLE